MIRSTALLVLLLGGQALCQAADAPLREPALGLDLVHFAEREAVLARRAGNEGALKGVAAGAYSVGAVMGALYAVGSLTNFGTSMGNAVVSAFGGAPAQVTNVTPLLGFAIASLSVGLIATALAIASGSSVSAEREVLEHERHAALLVTEAKRRARWAKVAAPPPVVMPAAVDPTPAPSDPPPPPVIEPNRAPLRPAPTRDQP